MSVISDGGIKFGKVTVDKETGRTKIAQQVNGVDIGTTIDEIKKAKLAITDLQQDKIDTNTKSIAALTEFQKKLLNLNLSTAELANRIGYNKDRVQSVFNTKTVTSSTSDYATLKATSLAHTSNHTLVVSQLASYDNYKTTISAPLSSSDLNLTGSIKIGAGNPDTLKQIDITATQSLSDIVSSINNWTTETGVTAEVALVSSGTPNNTYQLRLSAKETGTPLILEDVTGNILGSWNLIHGKEMCYQSEDIATTSSSTPLGLTGLLKVQAQDGIEQTVDLNGLSLDGIKSALDAVEAASKVHAEIIPIYAPNALSTDLPISHQLKLTTTSGQPLEISNSDSSALTGLELDSLFTTSFNSSISTTDVTADQGVTGILRVKAASAAEVSIDTAGKSLQQIAAEINTYTLTHSIAARVQLVTPANPDVAGSKSIYQLTINTTDDTRLQISNSDATAITGLKLNKPTNDYQSLIAKINLDGTDYQRSSNSITNALTGVTIDLVSVNAGATNTTFEVEEDHEPTITAFTNFFKSYNELVSFYNIQTATTFDAAAKKIEPAEGADLWDNKYIKDFMASLSKALNTAVSVTEEGVTKIMSISSLGLGYDENKLFGDPEYGLLTIKDKDVVNTVFNQRFEGITQFFSNKVSNTDPEFLIKESPFVLPAGLKGKDIDIIVQRTGPLAYTATATVGGILPSHPLDVTINPPGSLTPVLTLTGRSGTPLSGTSFSYVATIPDGDTVDATINIKPGIMAEMDGLILKTTDANKNPNTSIKAPYDVMGELLQEVGVLSNKNTQLAEEIANKKADIEKEMESMERKFDRVYEAQSKYREVQMMLASWMKSNER